MKASVVCVVLCIVAGAQSFKAGAPERQCEGMRPYHGETEPQTSKSPFSVSFSKNKIVAGERISVKIESKAGERFRGYMIQARVGNTPVGKFSSSKTIKVLNCGDSTNNTATHSENGAKARVNLFWTAPKDLSETVVFKYTIVKDFENYWVLQDSPKLTVVKS